MKKLLLLTVMSISLCAKTQTIVFGAGCFWGVERYYDNLDGVLSAKSGYHQNYLQKNPNGYCPNHSTGIKFVAVDTHTKSISPLGGKEIVEH